MRKTVHSASFPGWAICAYLSGSPGLHSERDGVTALEVAGLPQTTLGTSLLSLILMGPDLRNTRFGTTAVGKRPRSSFSLWRSVAISHGTAQLSGAMPREKDFLARCLPINTTSKSLIARCLPINGHGSSQLVHEAERRVGWQVTSFPWGNGLGSGILGLAQRHPQTIPTPRRPDNSKVACSCRLFCTSRTPPQSNEAVMRVNIARLCCGAVPKP